MEFYEKLKKLRKESGMSQEELADQLNVSRQAVSKWESGQGYPETDKLIQIGSTFGVTLDYLLKDEAAKSEDEAGYYASRETVEGYLASKKQGSVRIAIGVAIIIASLVFPMAFRYNMHGNVCFFIGVAIGLVILILQGFRPKRYLEVESQPLVFDAAYIKEFRLQYAVQRKRYGLLVVGGLLLVVASFIWAMFSNGEGVKGAIMPILWAVAVFMFIIAGSALTAGSVIANNTAHVKDVSNDKKNGWIFASIMPLAAMAFLAIGFIWGAWHPGWLVFPVAALLCTGTANWRNSK